MLTPYADVKFRLCVHELSIYLSLTAPGKPFLFAMSTIAVESDIAHAFTFIHVTGLLLSSSTIRYLPVSGVTVVAFAKTERVQPDRHCHRDKKLGPAPLGLFVLKQ